MQLIRKMISFSLKGTCQKPARQQGLSRLVALPYGRASDTNPKRTRPLRKRICLSEPCGTRRGCEWGERTCGCLNQEFSRYPHKRRHQRQTKGVAVTVNCNGPRLTLTTLIRYKPLWLTVELSTATPFDASTV